MTNILLISTFLHCLLGGFLLVREKRDKTSVYFAFFLIGIGLWSLTNDLFQRAHNYEEMFLWAVLAYTVTTIMLFFLLMFSRSITGKLINLKPNTITYIVTIISFCLPFIPNWVLLGVDFNNKTIIGGNFLFILFLTYIYFLIVTGNLLFKSVVLSTGQTKTQLKVITIGIFIAIWIGVICNLIFPSFNNYSLVAIGPSFTLLSLSFVALAIIRYQFLEIRIIFGRITYFFLTGSVAYIAFYLIIIIENALFGSVFSPTAHLVGVVIAIAFVATFNYTNRFIRKQVNSRLINPFYDPNEEITDFNGKVTTTLDYEKIAQAAIETFAKTLRPSYEGLLVIRNGNDDLPDSIKLFEGKTQKIFNVNELKLLQGIWKIVGFVPINVDKIENSFPPIFKNLESEIGRVTAEMNKHNIKILYPLVQSGEILGILFLGQKEAELPYNSIENEFIASIANIASLALARAFLYTEVREFNHTLQQKIEAATKEIQEKNQKLQDTLNFERDMLDILGHELRTPLGTARNALLTLQKLSLDGKLETDNLNKLLSLSIDHIRREVQLLETILASTKVDNAKLDLDITEVDAKKVATTSFEIYSSDAQKKGLDIGLHLPDTDIICMADSLRLQQVIDNIVSNAIKYTSKGQIVIEVKNLDDYVCFAIKDTGEGIAANEIPNLGKKFYRVNTYLKSEGKLADDRKIVRPGGTGIGLYVVFELTKAMKGKVEVKSKPAEGSVFSVFIPKKKSQDYLL